VAATKRVAVPPWGERLRFVRRLRRDPLQAFVRLWREYGDIVRLPLGVEDGYLLSNPSHVAHVLQANQHNYRRSRRFNREREQLFGASVLTAEAEVWKRRRQLTQPAFRSQALESYAATMVEATAHELDRWQQHLDGGPWDVTVAANRLTIQIFSRTLLGQELQDHSDALLHATETIATIAAQRLSGMIRWPLFLPLPSHRRFKRNYRRIHGLVGEVLQAARRTDLKNRTDIVARLLRDQDADLGRPASDAEIHTEVLNFLLAGFDTSATALAWTIFMTARHPEVQARMAAEVDRVLGHRAPTTETIAELTLTTNVIQEAMRLYPPAWILNPRQAIESDQVDEYEIQQGATIVILPYILHRDPQYWPEPELFDPDRFLPARSVGRAPQSYLPFGAGARVCAGLKFAMIELTIALAMILQRYRLRVEPDHPIKLVPEFVLRNQPGIRISLNAADQAGRR
jgi:cytochrome P450